MKLTLILLAVTICYSACYSIDAKPTEESDEADVSQESFGDYKIEIVPSNQEKAVKKSSTVYVHVPKDIFSTVVRHGGGPKNGSDYFGVEGFSIRVNNQEVYEYIPENGPPPPLRCLVGLFSCIALQTPPLICMTKLFLCIMTGGWEYIEK